MAKYTDEDVELLLQANQAQETNLTLLQKGQRATEKLLTQAVKALKDSKIDEAMAKLEEAWDRIDDTILMANQMLIDTRGPLRRFGKKKKAAKKKKEI